MNTPPLSGRAKAFIIGVGLIVFGLAGREDYEQATADEVFYCQMVQIWRDNADLPPQDRPGWPPFKPEIHCPEGFSVR
jgi:hypothetical protein